ncbi:hypothetical protein [Synechococcus phage Ssp-JY38]|nr:hypothetical protein [Synechococcus phage Yong-L2-223]
MRLHLRSPSGPKIPHPDTQARRWQAAIQFERNMFKLCSSYVQVGGLCTITADLPNGKKVPHTFSVPKGLTFAEVDDYIAAETDWLEALIEKEK